MRKSYVLLIGIFILTLQSCSSLNQLKRFGKCDFELKRIENIRIANIDVTNIKSFSDFTYKDAARLGEVFLTKKIPLNFTFVVEITNKSRKKAVLEKLDYIVIAEKKEVAIGKIEQRIELGSKNVPTLFNIPTELDIVNFFQKPNMKDNVILALRLISSDNIYNDIELKVKPYIRVGTQFVSAPHFVSIKKNKK